MQLLLIDTVDVATGVISILLQGLLLVSISIQHATSQKLHVKVTERQRATARPRSKKFNTGRFGPGLRHVHSAVSYTVRRAIFV